MDVSELIEALKKVPAGRKVMIGFVDVDIDEVARVETGESHDYVALYCDRPVTRDGEEWPLEGDDDKD